jgi:hypothetical protein
MSSLKASSEEGIMHSVAVPEASRAEHSSYLAANGATLMLVGLLCGLGVAVAPYPRLMPTAHIQFLVNGMMSIFAALLLRTSLAILGPWTGWLIPWLESIVTACHVVPALLLIAAWIVLVAGIYSGFAKRESRALA